MINERKETDGVESTFATNTLGTYHLTQLLIPTLKKSNGRVVTVSSGGMYNVSLSVDDLETKRPGYNGSLAYAQTKRAQVELTDYWSKKHPEILFYSMHPGWSSTEGIQKSLPALQSTLGSMLRTPEQGADTIVWAAVSNQVKEFPSASFFLDRKLAPLHLWLSGTRTEVGLVEKLVDKLDDYLSKI